MSLAPRRIAALLFIAFALAGCDKPAITQQGHATEASAKPGAAQAHASTLAITRSVDIELAPEAIAPAFASARAACEAEGADACVLLEASLTSGESPSAKIRLRAPPASMSRILARLRSGGGIFSESTTAEDLAAPIVETDRRVAMQREYRDSLLALRAKGGNDINALIRVNQELAQVQSELESATGERAQLQQRIATETLTVSFRTPPVGGEGNHPIEGAVGQFGAHLADAAGGTITFVAYLIPWACVLLPLAWVVRWLWRRRRSTRA